jgi:hypothetical protein
MQYEFSKKDDAMRLDQKKEAITLVDQKRNIVLLRISCFGVRCFSLLYSLTAVLFARKKPTFAFPSKRNYRGKTKRDP